MTMEKKDEHIAELIRKANKKIAKIYYSTTEELKRAVETAKKNRYDLAPIINIKAAVFEEDLCVDATNSYRESIISQNIKH